MTVEINKERYIGDGVYASFDGYHIWLTTQEGHRIALEPEVFANLLTYKQAVDECVKAATTATEEKQEASDG